MLWSERQKMRGVKLSLTWWRDRWKKKIDGKVVYFRQQNSAEGYQQALLDLAKVGAKDQEEIDRLASRLPTQYLQRWDDRTIADLQHHVSIDPAFAGKALASLGIQDSTTVHMFGERLDRFLEWKRQQAEAGSRSIGTWTELKKDLVVAEKFFGTLTPIKQLTGDNIRKYYSHLGTTTGRFNKPLSEQRKHNIFRSFKQFVRWLERADETQLPLTALKALKDPELTFAESDKGQQINLLYTSSDVQQAMNISARWRAIILLCLNCGIQQTDIASLKFRQLQNGYLVHKRRKTRRQKTPPTICYKLWPETLEALAELPKPDNCNGDSLIFTSAIGGPLVTEKIIKKDGDYKASKWDNIGHEWTDLRKANLVCQKPLKFLRKTGATILRRELLYAGVYPLYLGHSPSSVADKHYGLIDGEPFKPLDMATDFIRETIL